MKPLLVSLLPRPPHSVARRSRDPELPPPGRAGPRVPGAGPDPRRPGATVRRRVARRGRRRSGSGRPRAVSAESRPPWEASSRAERTRSGCTALQGLPGDFARSSPPRPPRWIVAHSYHVARAALRANRFRSGSTFTTSTRRSGERTQADGVLARGSAGLPGSRRAGSSLSRAFWREPRPGSPACPRAMRRRFEGSAAGPSRSWFPTASTSRSMRSVRMRRRMKSSSSSATSPGRRTRTASTWFLSEVWPHVRRATALGPRRDRRPLGSAGPRAARIRSAGHSIRRRGGRCADALAFGRGGRRAAARRRRDAPEDPRGRRDGRAGRVDVRRRGGARVRRRDARSCGARTPRRFARAVATLLGDPAAARRQAAAARARVEKEYGWGPIGESFARALAGARPAAMTTLAAVLAFGFAWSLPLVLRRVSAARALDGIPPPRIGGRRRPARPARAPSRSSSPRRTRRTSSRGRVENLLAQAGSPAFRTASRSAATDAGIGPRNARAAWPSGGTVSVVRVPDAARKGGGSQRSRRGFDGGHPGLHRRQHAVRAGRRGARSSRPFGTRGSARPAGGSSSKRRPEPRGRPRATTGTARRGSRRPRGSSARVWGPTAASTRPSGPWSRRCLRTRRPWTTS